MRASEWAFNRIKESFDLVAKDEAEKMSIEQEIMLESTDYLRRIIAPVERSTPAGVVRFVEKRNRLLVVQ